MHPTGLSRYRQWLQTQKLLSQLWLILQQLSVPQAWEAGVEAKLDVSELHCASNRCQHRHRHRHLSVVWPLECAGLMRFVSLQPKNAIQHMYKKERRYKRAKKEKRNINEQKRKAATHHHEFVMGELAEDKWVFWGF